MLKLTVISTPDKKLVYSNEVYFSPLDAQLKGAEYLLIDKVPFLSKPHPDVKQGEIGLSQPQRSTAKCNTGDTVTCSVWKPNAELFALRLEIDVAVKKRTEVKEDEFAKWFLSAFNGQPFTRGQELIIQYQGNYFTLRVLTCSIPDKTQEKKKKEGDLVKYAEHGVLKASTDVEIEPNKTNKLLEFKKSPSARRSALFKPDWKFEDMGIGGLSNEFSSIFRRAFASRLFPPAVIEQLGIKHVKGMLLYGPPGTGKTLIARQIGKMLVDKEPKVVNGPEILNKFVGQSEENIRKLFAEAEKDYKENKEHAELHIIIFDEIDAICKKRGTHTGGTDVHDTVVNQLLSKIDGVESLDNILVIGMTNRKDMIDPALLRPGRLEVHIEIGLPDEDGRHEIFRIHTRKMSENNRLHSDVDLRKLAQLTRNFSGAEIEGVVKSASSFALYGSIDVTKQAVTAKKDLGSILITMNDFIRALDEVDPAFGVAEDDLKNLIRGPLYEHGAEYKRLVTTVRTLIEQVRTSDSTPLLSVLLQGVPGCGKTTLAAQFGLESKFPFVKLISPEKFLSVSEVGKTFEIARTFEDSYKSPLSLIIIDDIERLLDYVPIGPRFSNNVLQLLLVALKRIPPVEGRKLMIIATTSASSILVDMQLRSVFNVRLTVPQLDKPAQVAKVLGELGSDVKIEQLETISTLCPLPIGIKPLLLLTETARQGGRVITPARFKECIADAGLGGAEDES